MELSDLDVLHAVRLRGVASPEAIAAILGAPPDDIDRVVGSLSADGLVFMREGRRVSGWVLTDEGRARHGDLLAAGRPDDPAFVEAYDVFLESNGRLKSLCGDWQAADDQEARWSAVEKLESIHRRASRSIDAAGAIVDRFGRHGARLQSALDLLLEGDERYFTSPLVDSYHTVWFEIHEDFLLTLGRDRAAEGSF